MAAARVLHPVMLSEFCKIRANPSTVSRNLPCGRQLNRIKRDLFGPVNPAETNKILCEELEKHQEKALKKWGFDFRVGSPSVTVSSPYIWERITYQESAYTPEIYTLTRAAHIRPAHVAHSPMDLLMDERAERENLSTTSTSTDTDSCDESHDDPLSIFKVPAVRVHTSMDVVDDTHNISTAGSNSANTSPYRRRQPKITEYMKERKRLAQTAKKFSPPAKRMRTNSGGSNSSNSSSSSSSSSSVSHSAHAHSISAHFTLRNSQRRF